MTAQTLEVGALVRFSGPAAIGDDRTYRVKAIIIDELTGKTLYELGGGMNEQFAEIEDLRFVVAESPDPAEIRAAREAAGLSQTAAADQVYSKLRTWQQWEAGDRRMHPGLWELFQLKIAALIAHT